MELKQISSKMNINRSFLDKWNFFSNSESVREIKPVESLEPEWAGGAIQSFSDSEGIFNYYYRALKSGSISFSISQNLHDYPLLLSIKHFFGAGGLRLPPYGATGSER